MIVNECAIRIYLSNETHVLDWESVFLSLLTICYDHIWDMTHGLAVTHVKIKTLKEKTVVIKVTIVIIKEVHDHRKHRR